MRTNITLFFSVWASISLLGCGGNTGTGKPTGQGTKATGQSGSLRIAVIPKGTTHEFWKSIHAGAEKAAAELGSVQILWKGGTTEGDAESQIRVVEDFMSQSVSAIVLAPTDRAALVNTVKSAKKRNIPVVIIDSGVDTEEITSYVATDNYNGGCLAARELAKQINGEGKVVVLRYMVGSDSTEQREKGFIDTIKKEFPKITIVSDNQYAGATEGEALRAAENLLTNVGDVHGWFCPCEPVTAATVKALASRGKVGKTKVVGFDAGSSIIPSFEAGHIHGLILQDPVNMGYLGVKTAVAAVRGETVTKKIGTGETVVTAANFNDPKIVELRSPDLKKWLKE